MSKTLLILAALAVVWFTAWQIAGYYMRQAGTEKLERAEYLSTPATRLEPGADVRVDGTIADGPTTVAPLSQKPCLAASASIHAVSVYTDSKSKTAWNYAVVATRKVGPESLEIVVGDQRIELPRERWWPPEEYRETMNELPERFGVTEEEIASARARLVEGRPAGFSVSEATLDGGTPVFVVGRLEDAALRLEADRVLGRILLHKGSQADYVANLQGSGGGLRTAGWILSLGVGPLPLMIVGLVVIRRRLRGE
jgi:hypothetical protein